VLVVVLFYLFFVIADRVIGFKRERPAFGGCFLL